MSRLAVRSELDKLGVTLELGPGELAFLEEVPPQALRALRVAVYEQLARDHRALFERLGAIARRLPLRVTVALAKRVGPLVAAQVVAETPSARAGALAVRVPVGFLADVCVHLDPRRTRDLIAQLPEARLADVARELTRRRDYITMSRFAEFLPDASVPALIAAIEDEGVLLRIAFYMGAKNRVDHLFQMLAAERREALIVRTQEEPEDLLPALLSLLVHVSYALKRELTDVAAAQDDSVLASYIRATDEQGLWPDMLGVLAAMSPAAAGKVVNLAILREQEVQAAIIRAADEHELWGVVLALVGAMDGVNRDAVAAIVAQRGPATLNEAAGAALMGERWEILLDLVGRMPPASQKAFGRVARGLGDADPDLLARLARRGEALGLSGAGAWVG